MSIFIQVWSYFEIFYGLARNFKHRELNEFQDTIPSNVACPRQSELHEQFNETCALHYGRKYEKLFAYLSKVTGWDNFSYFHVDRIYDVQREVSILSKIDYLKDKRFKDTKLQGVHCGASSSRKICYLNQWNAVFSSTSTLNVMHQMFVLFILSRVISYWQCLILIHGD